MNLAQCFSADYSGDPWHAYRRLRAVAAAPFAAFLDLEDNDALLCLSPERFISLHGNHVETSPIKGTRPRYDDQRADQLAATELRSSEKDRAENLMIVDLLRNDLGRSCIPGSIHVDRLFEVQSFPTVHHLVSTISGELQAQRSAIELLRDSFPGGSITGAPKRRAMEIIAELEPTARQAYCGSVWYISADGRMDSNIAIRSLQCTDGEVRCWGGGGIVADSQWQLEYQETYDKVGKFLKCWKTFPKSRKSLTATRLNRQRPVAGLDKGHLELFQSVEGLELRKFVYHILWRVNQEANVGFAQHGGVVIGVAGSKNPIIQTVQGLYGCPLGILLPQLVIHYPPRLVGDQAVTEQSRPFQLPHQRLGEFVEGIGKNDHLKALAQPVDEIYSTGQGFQLGYYRLDVIHLEIMLLQKPQALLHQYVIVGNIPGSRAQFVDAGAFGKGDPDFRDQDPFQVQAGQFHVSFSSGR